MSRITMNKRTWTFLVGMLLFVASVKAEYCLVVADSGVFNITDQTLAAHLPIGAGDVAGVDISGNDLPNMPIYFPGNMTQDLGVACRNACSNTANCQYYAYDVCAAPPVGRCWLKTAMSTPFSHSCRAYGFMGNSVPHFVGGGNYTMNPCHLTTCGSYANCQLCQNLVNGNDQLESYCTGYDYGATYPPLPSPYNTNRGYDMTFQGDSLYCNGGANRYSRVHVMCNQPYNRLVFLDEYAQCQYEYELYLTGNCTFTPPIPTLSFSSQSASSIKISIVPDTHLYNLDYPLDIIYTIYLDGNAIYRGATTTFIYDNLPPQSQEETYSFTVQGTYNGESSPISQVYSVRATTNTIPADQVTQDMISVLGEQVTQTGEDIKSRIDDVSSRIDVDVVQVLHHADDGTENIKQRLYSSNETLIAIQRLQTTVQTTVNGLDQRLSSDTITDMRNRIGNIDSQTNNLQSQLREIQNQFNKVFQQFNNQTTILQQGQSSGGSSIGGAGIAIGLIIGLVLGVIGGLVGNKVLQRVVSGPRYTNKNALMSPGMSLVDEE